MNETDIKTEDLKIIKEIASFYRIPYTQITDTLEGIVYDPNSENSHWNRTTKTVVFKDDSLEAKAEEFAHVARHSYQPDSESDIQEFFGGLSAIIIGNNTKKAFDEQEYDLSMKRKMLEELDIDLMTANNELLGILVSADIENGYAETFAKTYTPGLMFLKKLISNPEITTKNDYLNALRLNKDLDNSVRTWLFKEIESNGVEEAFQSIATLVLGSKMVENNDIKREESITTESINLIGASLKNAADQHCIVTHFYGYKMAQDIYDAGKTEMLLEMYPKLIQLPDKKVENAYEKVMAKKDKGLIKRGFDKLKTLTSTWS